MSPRKPCETCGKSKSAKKGSHLCSACAVRPTFWPQVDQGGECWLWTGRTWDGYGRYNGRGAHRVAYELLVGPIPAGLELDHLCRQPLCVNPAHLEPVTRLENMRRRSAAQTHCGRDHEFTPENTYYTPQGRRSCRACNNAAARRYNARKAAS